MVGRIGTWTGRAVVALVCATLGLAPVARAELVDRIAAVVNGQVVTLSEVEKRAAAEFAQLPFESDPKKRGERRKEVLARSLDALIGEKLLESEAKAMAITVSDADLKLAIEDVKDQNNLDDERFALMLRQEGFSVSEYERFMRAHLTRMKLVNLKVRSKVKIADADLKSEYARYANAEGGETEVEARHILVEVRADAPAAEIEQARKKAASLAQRARQPNADFDALIAEADGGDLGTFGRGVMMPDFERAAFSLKAGGVSDPVRSATGWHVINVTDVRNVAAAPFDEVKDQLRERLLRGQMEKYSQQYVQELRQKATVEVLL